MIFASDLDRTLIYSCKSFEHIEEKGSFVYIDRDSTGLNKSIMPISAVKMLKDFTRDNNFIPVTAREERHYYDRLRFDEFGISFDYAVLGNGAIIHYKGKEDLFWKEYVKNQMDKVEKDKIKALLFDKYGEENIRETTYGYEVRSDTSYDVLEPLLKDIKGIRLGNDHRFYYVLIDGIGKLDALKYVTEKLGKTKEDLIVAGDSFMDIPMIEYAEDRGILSLNGHINKEDSYAVEAEYKGVNVVNLKGIKSCDVILSKVIEICGLK